MDRYIFLFLGIMIGAMGAYIAMDTIFMNQQGVGLQQLYQQRVQAIANMHEIGTLQQAQFDKVKAALAGNSEPSKIQPDDEAK